MVGKLWYVSTETSGSSGWQTWVRFFTTSWCTPLWDLWYRLSGVSRLGRMKSHGLWELIGDWWWLVVILVMSGYFTGDGWSCYWWWLVVILVMAGHVTGDGWLFYWWWLVMLLVMAGHVTGDGWSLYWWWLVILLVMAGHVTGDGWSLYWWWLVVILVMTGYFTGDGWFILLVMTGCLLQKVMCKPYMIILLVWFDWYD